MLTKEERITKLQELLNLESGILLKSIQTFTRGDKEKARKEFDALIQEKEKLIEEIVENF